MQIALGRWNNSTARWEALFSGQVIASSRDKVGGAEYLKKVIEGGFSQKAAKLGVTKLEIVGENAGEYESEEAINIPSVENEFSINERFEIMESYVEMVAARELATTVVTGEGGLGKTHTVLKALKKAGLEDISEMEIGARHAGLSGYVMVKGFSTAKGMFRTLYENRDQIVVYDDCDNILRDPNAVNVLKGALDSYDKRVVTWNSEGFGGDDDLPKSFEFTGGVIFISNLPKHKIPQPIRSRALSADVSMTRAEVVERMASIIKSGEFMPDVDMDVKLEALAFVSEHAHNPLVSELNFRSLTNVVKARVSKPEKWERMALYAMVSN